MSIVVSHVDIKLANHSIIENLSYQFNSSELIAICGSNGAGKSTLLKAIAGELNYAGSIKINGIEVSTSKEKILAEHRAVMPQSVNLIFPFPVYEIIELGLIFCKSESQKNAIKNRVRDLFHLNDLWQRDYTQLSGGQQQRVQLARVIAQILQSPLEHRFLLLDECTSAMDIALVQEIFSVLNNLKQEGIGIIAIVHDINIASLYADQIIFLKDKHIYSSGSPEDVVTEATMFDVFGAKTKIQINEYTGKPAFLYC